MPVTKIRSLALILLLCALVILCAFVALHAPTYLLGLTSDWQRLFHDQIAITLQAIKENATWLSTGTLILIGFLYGALHAVGPGHGKVIVSSYLLATNSSLKKGVCITVAGSLLQACTAILIVFAFTTLFGLTKSEAEGAAFALEKIAFAFIVLLGLLTMGRGLVQLPPSSRHEHAHAHDDSCGCSCCAHAPSAQKLDKAQKAGDILLLVLSIGARPCSGALLLLVFADIVGLFWDGILATFAMGLGTAMTTSLLAILTVKSKELALKFTHITDGENHSLLGLLQTLGGVLILAFGLYFLLGDNATTASMNDSLTATQNHPLMRTIQPIR